MHIFVPCLLTALILIAVAPPVSAVPSYDIAPLGFDDLEHTRNDGYQYSVAGGLNNSGQVAGYSYRYNGGSTSLGQTAWLFDGSTISALGLTGAEYTRNDGYRKSVASRLNEQGQVIGYSSRYNGGNANLGQTVWLYNGSATSALGFAGPEYTRSDGYKLSGTNSSNDAGQVVGYSQRYNGSADFLGSTAWLYDGTNTINISLTGPEHTRSNGYQGSEAVALNAAGEVAGTALRFNGTSTDFGQTAWLYDGSTTIDISLAGPEHTRNDGYRFSEVRQMNAAGYVRGYADRFNGGSGFGQTAWLFNGTATIDIGLVGSEHTRNDGFKYSTAYSMNAAGQVLGHSYRYNGGSAQLGYSAWLYNGATTIDIGLTGPEYTRNDGYRFSFEGKLNEAGQVIGYSDRYNGGNQLGQTAWLYDGASTIPIGLTGTEHTRNDGYKSSNAQQVDEAGHVGGFSNRFSGGSADIGRSTWLYDGATTTNIGLADNLHTRNDGYKFSDLRQLSDAGQAIGISYRYNGGGTQLGQDAWIFEPALSQTLTLTLSTRSDGYAYSRADYLGDDGLVLGAYTLFDAQDNNLGDRAFYFTIADGLHDLGSLVDGGLAANGWESLLGDSAVKPVSTATVNALGQILGFGKRSSQTGGQFPYLLTPVLDGDFNRDGTVDAADYLIWRKSNGNSAGYELWRSNFGSARGATTVQVATTEINAVPEPSTWLLASLVAFLSSIVAGLGRIRSTPSEFLRVKPLSMRQLKAVRISANFFLGIGHLLDGMLEELDFNKSLFGGP